MPGKKKIDLTINGNTNLKEFLLEKDFLRRQNGRQRRRLQPLDGDDNFPKVIQMRGVVLTDALNFPKVIQMHRIVLTDALNFREVISYYLYPMKKTFKPEGYNSVSPYFIVDNCKKMLELLKGIFDAKELRKYENSDGSIMHVEIKVDDSVIMLADSSKEYPANKLLLHVYVPDVKATFKKAVALGCEVVEEPVNKEGDPDMRGTFKDFQGNTWAIGTQVN